MRVHTKNANCSDNYVNLHINGRSENALKMIPIISFLYAIIFNVVVSALLLGCGHISEISRTKKVDCLLSKVFQSLSNL